MSQQKQQRIEQEIYQQQKTTKKLKSVKKKQKQSANILHLTQNTDYDESKLNSINYTLPPISQRNLSYKSATSQLKCSQEAFSNISNSNSQSDENSQQQFIGQCHKMIEQLQRFTQLSRKRQNRLKYKSSSKMDSNINKNYWKKQANREQKQKISSHVTIKIPIIFETYKKPQNSKLRNYRINTLKNSNEQEEQDYINKNIDKNSAIKDTFRSQFKQIMEPNGKSSAVVIKNQEIQINSRIKNMRNQQKRYPYVHNNVNDGHTSLIKSRLRASNHQLLKSLQIAKKKGNSLQSKIQIHKEKKISVDNFSKQKKMY